MPNLGFVLTVLRALSYFMADFFQSLPLPKMLKLQL